MVHELKKFNAFSEEVLKLPSMAEMKSNSREQNRRESFKWWPFDSSHKCNPAKLAEAGFYYLGTSKDEDLVCCFVCGKTLDSWESEDEPWSEHLKHAPQCSFARAMKREGQQTVLEFIQFRASSFERILKDEVNNKRKAIRKEIDNLKEIVRNA